MRIQRAGSFSLGYGIEMLASRGDTGNAVGGGAGYGSVSSEIAKCLSPGRRVIAYEPFPGNHRLWRAPKTVELRRRALGSEQGVMTLAVSSTVASDSAWGRRGLAGYSSSGRLTKGEPDGPNDVEVSVVAGDVDLARDQPIGVVKLDLQGGEAAAIEGLSSTLKSSVLLCWVEFLPRYSDYSLIDRLASFGFEVFDTEYVFKGDPSEAACQSFSVVRTSKVSSSGARRWRGIPSKEWVDYESQFEEARTKFGLLQTDLLCVRGEFANLISAVRERL